jgi:hypothetical protein
MEKKTVHYDIKKGVIGLSVGQCAICHPIDHPDTIRVTNTCAVKTSRVLAIHPEGVFETMNSLYKPKQVD